MSRKKQQRSTDDAPDAADAAVSDEILAEGSGPVTAPTTVEELAEAVDELEARAEAHEAADDIVADDVVPDDVVAEPLGEPVMAASDAAIEGAEPGEAVAVAEDGEPAVLPSSVAVALDDAKLKHLVEAIVFAAEKPVTMQRLRQLTRIADVRRIEQALELLAVDYADRGIALRHVSGGYQFRTNTTYSAWVQQLVAGRPVRLSRAQLETLAIVAYRQPITRPEIDEIRGVDSSATLRLLLDRSLIRVLGKREEVGRPMLYGTTGEFLDFFSLQDLRELPTLREYSELTAESRQVMSDRLGIGLDDEVAPEPMPEADAAMSDVMSEVMSGFIEPEPATEPEPAWNEPVSDEPAE
ncbi:MAG TPA: SMC-Scp complex subunit ScpB [Kofleriaceae bacterium]